MRGESSYVRVTCGIFFDFSFLIVAYMVNQSPRIFYIMPLLILQPFGIDYWSPKIKNNVFIFYHFAQSIKAQGACVYAAKVYLSGL